jgi:sugar/nucleoside kinase (ribokinase family)
VSPSRVLIVGDVMDDVVAVISQPLRPDTDTPATIQRTLGGSAANTAVWLAGENIGVDFVGRVGASDFERVNDQFSQAGVVAHLSADPARETGALVIIAQGQTRSMATDRGANLALDPRDISPSVISGCSWLHLTGYSFFHHDNPELMSSFITEVANTGIGVMVDASSSGFLEDCGPEKFLEMISPARVVRCNEDEARVLTGASNLEDAVKILATRFSCVVATSGAKGALVWEDGALHVVPAIAAEVVDPTGAGDSFNAGILAGLASGASIVSSAQRAAELSARCVTLLGARP